MLRSNKPIIVLGIDPGIADTGFGVLCYEGGKMTALDYGSIKTKAKVPLPDRLAEIYFELNKIIKKYQPEVVAIEQLFFCKNLKTATAVGQARGVVILAVAQHHLMIKEFTPLQVKLALTSYGKAEKSQIQQMVKLILKLREIPKPDDAADALAIAICGANSYALDKCQYGK
jgi:crossover junction endodeoxyribonuclease RuvC